LKNAEAVRDFLSRRYRHQCRAWLRGEGQWPLVVSLGCPTEEEAQQSVHSTRAWVTSWQQWKGPGQLTWCERRWRSMGTQRLPEQLILESPADVAEWIDETERWARVRSRYRKFTERWPALAARLPRYFDSLATYSDTDIERLLAIIGWLECHPRSNLYPRQLPVAGLDTKWLESRKSFVADLIETLAGSANDSSHADAGAALNAASNRDFYALCGLRRPPTTVRLLVLDDALRRQVNGLRDITVSIEELAHTSLPARRFYVVENIQTALAFEDLPESVVIMGLGYGIDILSRIAWLKNCECTYWGDLDTHGFAILSRARAYLPQAESFMMDEATLLRYRALWNTESEQLVADDLPNLTPSEHDVFRGLKRQRWATNLRLEQERINWHEAWQSLTK